MSTQSTPSWPSLYNYLIEIAPIEHRAPIQAGGHYLYHPNDIYRYTLYWTLIFYCPPFLICGIYAFLNFTFPPSRLIRQRLQQQQRNRLTLRSRSSLYTPDIPLRPYGRASLSPDHPLISSGASTAPPPRIKQNERRSRLTFALIVLVVFLFFSLLGAVVGSAVIGYTLAGLYKAAHYNMSTWIPFFGGLIQALIGLLGLWPSVVDII